MWQKVWGLMHFVAANEDDEALTGGDEVAFAARWIVHGVVGGFRVLLFGLRRRNALCVRVLATNSSER